MNVPYVPPTESPPPTVFVKPDSSKYLDQQNVYHVVQNVLLAPNMENVPTVSPKEYSHHLNVLALKEHSKTKISNASHVVINA
jgi:hypothetical protein